MSVYDIFKVVDPDMGPQPKAEPPIDTAIGTYISPLPNQPAVGSYCFSLGFLNGGQYYYIMQPNT